MKNRLFESESAVVNIGLKSFRDTLEKSNVKVVQVDWKPPLITDAKMSAILDENCDTIEAANKVAVGRILDSKPSIIGMGKALEVIPGMKKNLFLHAGPPIGWDRMWARCEARLSAR